MPKRIAQIILLVSYIFSNAAHSALPPAAESMRRLKAIAESPSVYDRIGVNDSVKGINQVKEGYTVTTNRCVLKVHLNEISLDKLDPPMVGPARLEVIIDDMKCGRSRR